MMFQFYKCYKGVLAWQWDFALRQLERYYRVSVTFCLYILMVRVLIVTLISFRLDLTLIYVLDFAISFFIVLPGINRFIIEKKIEENEENEAE